MPPTAALIARDQRLLCAYATGATISQLALAEEVDYQVIRRVLPTARNAAGGRRNALSPAAASAKVSASRFLVGRSNRNLRASTSPETHVTKESQTTVPTGTGTIKSSENCLASLSSLASLSDVSRLVAYDKNKVGVS